MQKDWTQDVITVDGGVEIFYTRTGGEKPKIVLIHGLTDSGACWKQLASDLVDNFDVIMYDAYGHGKSSRVDPERRFDLVEDLHDLIMALELEKPALIGHSMGAMTAASFAAKYPDKLNALVLEDPPWSDQPFDADDVKSTMQRWKKHNLSVKEKSVKELMKLQKKEAPSWEDAIFQDWAQAKHELDPAFFDHFPIREVNWRELIKSIEVPTLIVTGDRELGAIVTPKMGIDAVEMMEKGEFGHISSAGHCVRYEQYQPYLTMVKLFLKRNHSA